MTTTPTTASPAGPMTPKLGKLYLYRDLASTVGDWAANPAEFRRKYPNTMGSIIRVAHPGVMVPHGYHKPNGHLACDAIEPLKRFYP